MSSKEQMQDENIWEIPVKIVHATNSLDLATKDLIALYIRLARKATTCPDLAPGLTIIDCSALVSVKRKEPALYTMSHVRRQFGANPKLLMTVFHDDGGHMSTYGDKTNKAEPGTYMIVLKRVDIEKMQFVPVSPSAIERQGIKNHVVDQSQEVAEA
ncbi:hypothetical protein E2P81_ATG05228 [Venturia nashicola]|nr:hypothetical protein E2P81_ATG05228 [Venturia nashicola]